MEISTKDECIKGIMFWSNELKTYFKYLSIGEKHEIKNFNYANTCIDNLVAFFLTYKLFHK